MPKQPVVSGKQVVAALKKVGFAEVRQKGSHKALRKITPEKTYKIIVPLHKELA